MSETLAASRAPTDVYAFMQWNMIHAHASLRVGYENILRVLEDPPLNDLQNFLGYCSAWTDVVKEHHDSEEVVVFPFLNQKLDFSNEIEEHKVIHDALDTLYAIIKEGQKSPGKFDSKRLKEHMEGFRTPLIHHLDEEVIHLQPENLKVFSEAEMKKHHKEFWTYVKSNGDPFVIPVFMRSHTPPEMKEAWPAGMPWILRKVMIPWLLYYRHRGWWKYAPYAP